MDIDVLKYLCILQTDSRERGSLRLGKPDVSTFMFVSDWSLAEP